MPLKCLLVHCRCTYSTIVTGGTMILVRGNRNIISGQIPLIQRGLSITFRIRIRGVILLSIDPKRLTIIIITRSYSFNSYILFGLRRRRDCDSYRRRRKDSTYKRRRYKTRNRRV
jgi:hypothetical protein